MSIKYFQNVICRLAAGQGANRRFQIMFRKFCFRKQAAGGFRRRGPTRRAFARCVRCHCTGFFSAVGRACLARHGAALIVGLAAPRRPRRQPRGLQLLVRGLRLLAASWLLGRCRSPAPYCGSMASSATWSACRAKVPGQDALRTAIQGRVRVLRPRPRAAALRRARPPRRREGLFVCV